MPFETDLVLLPPRTQDIEPAAASDDYVFEGHVDFYGYHAGAQGWFFGGWLAHPWPIGNRPHGAVAHFAQAAIAEHGLSAFYYRADVEHRGIGFVFYLRAPAAGLGPFLRLGIAFSTTTHDALPTQSVLVLPEHELVAELQPVLAGGEDGSQRRKMLDLLQRDRGAEAVGGFIDCYGYHAAAGGWLFCGWAAQGWDDAEPPARILASFEEGDVGGEMVAARYPRDDLKEGATGTLFFLPGSAASLGSLCSVSYDASGVRSTLFPGASTQRLRESELAPQLQPLLAQAPPGLARDSLLALLARRPYTGQDTLAGLGDPVLIEIDEAIVCEPDGLVLVGWCLARPGTIREIRLRCGPRVATLDLAQAIAVERPDVLAAQAAPHGFDDARCGFVAFLPQAVVANHTMYLEVETVRRELGFRTIPRPRLTGMPAIRRILECIDSRFADLPRAFDRVLGPAVQTLNRSRLRRRPGTVVADYGRLPAAPAYSVIVPLYGRLDFVEYQLALFSAHPGAREIEFIYVLDDPPKRREAQALFVSLHERFGVPFRAVLLDSNVGFAPASNIGLEHARGGVVGFLNSDVFPGTPDWLERLAARLAADPELGVVGPVLLFDDGSVQHQGMDFERLREFGDWFFPLHGGKGMRRGDTAGLHRCISITGACMVMRRDLARTIGGFDETYAIGDFEDSDLCLKLQALGHACAVDHDVQLFHLERKSQASSAIGWRMNLTLYNAWQHERRWGTTIAAHRAGHGQIA